MTLNRYTKAILAIIAAVLVVLVSALSDGHVSAIEATNSGIAGVTAVGVYLVPNLASGPGRYLKLVVAVLGAVLAALLTVLTNALGNGITPADLITLVLAGIGAAGVGIVPNAPQALSPLATDLVASDGTNHTDAS